MDDKLTRRKILMGIGAGAAAALLPSLPAAADRARRQPRTAGTAGSPLPSWDPGNSAGWTPNPDFTDEFDGTSIDWSKWTPFTAKTGSFTGRLPQYFTVNGAYINDGVLSLTTNNLNYVQNPAFDQGLLYWTPGVPGDPNVTGTDVSTFVDHSSFYNTQDMHALRCGPNSGVNQLVSGLTPSTSYTLTAFATASDGAVATIGSMGSTSSTSSTYTLMQVDFTTDSSTTQVGVGLANDSASGTAQFTFVGLVVSGQVAPGFYYQSDALATINEASYGAYEISAKVANASVISDFWFAHPVDTYTEIDVIEIMGHSNLYPYLDSLIPNSLEGPRNDSTWYETGVHLSDSFHTYGLDWEPDTINWYFDGELTRSVPNSGYTTTQFIILDIEGAPWNGNPDPQFGFPANYLIDYIRAWTKS